MFKQALAFSLSFSLFLPSVGIASPRQNAINFWNQVHAINQAQCEDDLSALAKGRVTHREVGAEFAVDDYTWGDLDGANLILPIFAQYSPSLLGRLRLAAMLRETSIDSAEIRARQVAVQELAADPNLLRDLQAFLKAFAKIADESEMIKFAGFTEDEKIPTILMESMIALMTYSFVAGGAYSLAMDAPIKGMLVAGLTPLMMLNAFASVVPAKFRQRHIEIKKLIQLGQNLRVRLENAKSPLLTELVAALGNYNPRNYDSPQNRMVRRYLNVQSAQLTKHLMNVGFVSSITMRVMNGRFAKARAGVMRLGTIISELGALSALAEYSTGPDLAYPRILDDNLPTQLRIVQGHHPFVLKDQKEKSIANDVELSAAADSGQKFMLLTGINTGGKSTALRMIATNILIGQMGAPIPAQYAEWTPMAVLTNMNVNDSVAERASFFRAQVTRVRDIFKSAKEAPRAIVLMDEIFTGTSPEEHHAAEVAVIQYLLETNHIAVLATHDRSLAQLEEQYPNFKNYHVGDTDQPKFVISPGVSKTRNAADVMRDVGMPEEFLRMMSDEKAAE